MRFTAFVAMYLQKQSLRDRVSTSVATTRSLECVAHLHMGRDRTFSTASLVWHCLHTPNADVLGTLVGIVSFVVGSLLTKGRFDRISFVFQGPVNPRSWCPSCVFLPSLYRQIRGRVDVERMRKIDSAKQLEKSCKREGEGCSVRKRQSLVRSSETPLC